MTLPQHPPARRTAAPAARSRRGFLLLLVVGMLAVLTVLGISFVEQGRAEILGAGNARDLSATDGLAETGFEFALRALADDANAWSARNSAWNTARGPGWTSRWGYNSHTSTAAPSGVQSPDPAPNRASPQNFLESWQALIWNEEDKGTNSAFMYDFKFENAAAAAAVPQRLPMDEKIMQDVWPLQPLARVRRFLVQTGTNHGIVQIGISPTDGALNVNDPFDPNTASENPGWHDTQDEGAGTTAPVTAADARVRYASPDRRTLEYVLGRRPEFANRNQELVIEKESGLATTPQAAMLHGNHTSDDGIYNFRTAFEPRGHYNPSTGSSTYSAYLGDGFVTNAPSNCPTVFYNSSPYKPYRYNFEGARYPLWSTGRGMSTRNDLGGMGPLAATWVLGWFPTGRFNASPFTTEYGSPGIYGDIDSNFYGFGFDLFNSARGGMGGAAAPWTFKTLDGKERYLGAGCYGFPKIETFQGHFMAAAYKGRFWTDLMLQWYMGGAPGYSGCLGAAQYIWWTNQMNNWAHLGSTYDSIGMGTQWMPPTMHVWLPGAFDNGVLGANEIAQGMKRYPGNMPPAKPAATYAYPLNKWSDDYSLGNAHFLFGGVRAGGVRAFGIQEDWGLFGQDDNSGPHNKGRTYDAVNINVSNFQTIYGLLTPEKLPSMLNRTVVAPHLHWKARMLDAAYEGMDAFARYDPQNTIRAGAAGPPAVAGLLAKDPYDPADATVPNRYGYMDFANVFQVYDPANMATFIGPVPYKYSVHRHYDPHPAATPGNIPRRVLGKMDYLTPEPLDYKDINGDLIRRGTGRPADDVFRDCHYDTTLSPNDINPASIDTPPLKVANIDHPNALMAPRPDEVTNWPDWFMQRRIVIPLAKKDPPHKPIKNTFKDTLPSPEGINPDLLTLGGVNGNERDFPGGKNPKPHPIHGLPNPDYLLLFPGATVSYFWADQFRRYHPVVYKYNGLVPNPDPLEEPPPAPPASPDPLVPADSRPPGAPPQHYKLVEADRTAPLHPMVPVGKDSVLNPSTAFIPGINKDEAWRITRAGRKYQEIIADEMMDYQINPWWPNPCVHLTEVAVPLDKTAYPAETRDVNAALNAGVTWPSYEEHKTAAAIKYNVPDFYAYYNRFWCRAAGKYKRGGDVNTTQRGEMFRCYDAAPGRNAVSNRGIYPQDYQYFGKVPPSDARWRDRITDFPFNTLEDQSGGEWRYMAGLVENMKEQPAAGSTASLRSAPARNHPFKNWADFVGMLGHLVYRSPMPPGGGAPRHPTQGVAAAAVCPSNFFDGSRIADADALQEGIVARAGNWPISGNHGEFPTPGGPALYPVMPAPWTDQAEWERRIDEMRGRDTAGLRIEHHYISEAAANDVLVNLSNGRVKPIDFDGDGHISMTRRDEIPEVDKYWKGFPWHNEGSNHLGAINVESQRKPNTTPGNALDYGLPADGWENIPPNEHLQGCVTVPIKFRSNTFRVTVLVSLTDALYKNVYTTRRYSRVFSRVPGAPSGAIKVHGPYTGKFVQHSNRIMAGVDPEMSWLGTK